VLVVHGQSRLEGFKTTCCPSLDLSTSAVLLSNFVWMSPSSMVRSLPSRRRVHCFTRREEREHDLSRFSLLWTATCCLGCVCSFFYRKYVSGTLPMVELTGSCRHWPRSSETEGGVRQCLLNASEIIPEPTSAASLQPMNVGC